jgi:hypothetical protein
MPTAAKLVASVLFALLSLFIADLYRQGITDGTRTTYLVPGCAAIGLICGWRVMGRLVGKGMGDALGSGIRTSLTIVFFALLLFSIYEMVVTSTKGLYDGPMEAVLAIFDIMLGYGWGLVTPELIGTILMGGGLAGMATEWADRRWP